MMCSDQYGQCCPWSFSNDMATMVSFGAECPEDFVNTGTMEMTGKVEFTGVRKGNCGWNITCVSIWKKAITITSCLNPKLIG